MSKKLYVCTNCGNVFPSELDKLIEKKTQVFCEKCGSPFTIEGITFKEKPYSSKPRYSSQLKVSDKQMSSLNNAIQSLNQWSYVPILIISIISLCLLAEIAFNPINWLPILVSKLTFGISGILIALYDILYISPKVEAKKYDEIVVNAFCWGILGSILFGTGAVLLLKGIFILFYVIIDSNKNKVGTYNFGLLLKNSLNQFSAVAGFIIIQLAIFGISIGSITVNPLNLPTPGNMPVPPPVIIYIIFFNLAIIVLFIDLGKRDDLKEKREFETEDFVLTIILGVLATLFFAAGVFIILKASVILLLIFGTPPPVEKKIPQAVPIKKEELEVVPVHPYKIPAKPKIEVKEDITPKELRKEIELKIHESLLPIQDEKDKELIKEYFLKIFVVLSKDIRNQIMDLKIPKKDKNEFLKELAFLTAEEQIKYIEGIVQIYQEIPIKLIERIRSLPNVRPEHYDKLINQLKNMDYEEQVKFVEFLELNA
jgi:DNA-directed RNA polymerase subunit RPC12/RpoP